MDSADSLQDYAVEIARLFPRQGRWREEDYFALPDSNQIIELSTGRLVMPPPPTPEHQTISGTLYLALARFVEVEASGRVLYSPVAVRLWEGKIREPDLLFIRREHIDRIKDRLVDGAPDWVAEIVSPSTRQTDQEEKLVEYAQAGIPEYWLIDPKARTVRNYTLPEGQTAYAPAGTYAAGQIASSVALPGFEVAVDKLFAV